jgi:hypothetical protein
MNLEFSIGHKEEREPLAYRSMMVMIGHTNAAEVRALAASIDNLRPRRSVFHVCVFDVVVGNNDFAPGSACDIRTAAPGIRGSE